SNGDNVDGWDDRFRKTAIQRAAMAGHKDVVELLISKGADIDAGEVSPIQLAVENGHKDIAELLIAKGADIDVKNETGNTLLHLAAQGAHKDVVELLVEKSVNINARNNEGRAPTHLAAQRGQRDMIKLLLEKGADVNAKDNDGNTLLQHALQQRRWSIAKDLIDAGVEVNATNNSGKYPLHIAARRRRDDLIKQLLGKGADVNAKDKEGDTALSMAAQGDHLKTMELLISRGADIHIKDNKGKFLADQCLGSGRKSIVDMLIAKGANTSTVIMAAYMGNLAKVKQYLQTGPKQDVLEEKGFYLLMAATTGGRTDVAIYLLDQGVKATYAENENITALHVASNVGNNAMIELLLARGAGLHAGNKWTPLEGAVWSKHKDAVRFLISKGANINHGPETALHRAVSWWSMEPAKRLLELGADINAKDENGNTPLHEAVDTWWPEVAEVLLSQGAKIDLKNNQDQTPLLMASDVGFYKMTRLLIDKGADIHAKDKQERTALDCALQNGNKQIAQLLESEGAKPSDGRNMLHRAAAGDNFREFKALLTQTLDISLRDAKDRNGFTPLHNAILFWRTGNAKLLIDKGADVDVQDNNGYTPLHYTAWQGMRDMAELLIDRGTNLNIQDNWGWTPLHRAVIAKQADIAKILIEEGADTNIKDKEGRTALWWAEDLGLEDTGELLKQTKQKETEAKERAHLSKEDTIPSEESHHDIAITDISFPENCYQNESVPITVSIANQGIYREAFSVTLSDKVSGEEIASKKVTLAKGWKMESDPVADIVFTGETPGRQQFACYVTAGDINNDGYDDLLMTASNFGNRRGRAYLYYGGTNMDNVPDKVFTGEIEGELLGEGNCLGDVNGDNYPDVILGACCYNSNQGRVHIYYGGPEMDTVPDITIVGEKTGILFGRRIEAYDIDRDGCDDVLIVANFYNNGTGRAYLYYGGDPFDTTAEVVFDGEYPVDRFGRQAAMGPDVNGDGYGEILIGARAWPEGKGQGRAYLYFGNTSECMDNICDRTFTGEEPGDELGASHCIFDIDKDGFADILIGARSAANWRGRVYIYWGSRDFDRDNPDVVLEGEPYSNMGGDDLVCGDHNGDGHGDVLAGAYNYPGYPTMRGRAYIYYGDTKNTMDTVRDKVFTGEEDRSMFGINVGAGDVNGDGFDDVVIGAWLYNDKQGRAYLYYGGPGDSTQLKFDWNTTKASPGKHTLKATIAPITGEEDVADNTRTVTVEVKEREQ
ncbi:ankyrin repeat domain-containing protein, partial [Planctomycetota bacterium]